MLPSDAGRRTTTGAELTWAESALVALDLLRGRALYLSEVPPLGYKHVAYLGALAARHQHQR